VKRLDLVRRREQEGCVLLRHGGRYDIYHNPKSGRSEKNQKIWGDRPEGMGWLSDHLGIALSLRTEVPN